MDETINLAGGTIDLFYNHYDPLNNVRNGTLVTIRPTPKKSDLGKWFMEGVETVTAKTIPWTKVP